MNTIYYDLHENPSVKKSKRRYHVRMTKPTETTFDELKQHLCLASSVTEGDVDSVLDGLYDYLVSNLSSGHRVNLGKLGSLTPSVKAPSVTDPKKMNATKVKLAGITYRPSDKLVKSISKNVRFARAQSNVRSLPITEDEMYQRLLDYFEENESISLREFQPLMNFTRGTAVRRLRELCKSDHPFLKHIGPRNSSVYVLTDYEVRKL